VDLRNPDVDHHTPLVDPCVPSPGLAMYTPSPYPYPSHHTHYPSVYRILFEIPRCPADNHQFHVGHRLICLDLDRDRDRFDLGILRLVCQNDLRGILSGGMTLCTGVALVEFEELGEEVEALWLGDRSVGTRLMSIHGRATKATNHSGQREISGQTQNYRYAPHHYYTVLVVIIIRDQPSPLNHNVTMPLPFMLILPH
jgi:hypothetical protein